MIKRSVDVVLFDFGGVIADEGFVKGLTAIAEVNQLDPEPFIKTGFELVHKTGYVIGKSDEKTFWRALRERTGIIGTDEFLRDHILSRFTLRIWMFEVVSNLRSAGIHVGILSDQTNWLDELDEEYDFFRRFDHVFSSYHMGKSKRDETTFDEVLKLLNAKPHRMLFVDDFRGNCERAKGKGIKVILYSDKERFLTELRQYCP